MSKKFLYIVIYCMCFLAIPHSESKAQCVTYRLYPWNSWFFGPWFSMNYTSCKDKQIKLVRQGYSNDPLVATDVEYGTHVAIGHMGTNEDWYPEEKADAQDKDITCFNVPAQCSLGTPSSLQAKQKYPIPKVKTPEVKTPRGRTIH